VRPRATTTLILALAAGLAAGCGSDEENGEPIPPDQAAALQRQLESIENRFRFGGDACADITGNADPNTTAVRSVLDSLPQDVDPDLRDSLEQSFDRLFELVQEQCDTEAGQEQEQPPPVETQPTETIPPEEDEGDEDDEEGDEETPPPTEETPPATEPPAEVPPEEPTDTTGQGGGGSGDSAGQGGSGSAGQGGGGGALVPGDSVP
jgi:hypothetical protein